MAYEGEGMPYEGGDMTNISTAPLPMHEVELFTDYPPALLQFAAGCCLLYIVVGIPGNVITIVALSRYKKAHNATAIFIINLSVSDLLLCCFNLPLSASLFIHRAWVHGQALCVLFPVLRYGLIAVSLFTILAITFNRYIIIAHPDIYNRVYSPRALALMLTAIWLSVFAFLVPTLSGRWGHFGLDPTIGSCTILPNEDGSSPKDFLFVFAFLLPAGAICVCYVRIFLIVRRAERAARHGPGAGPGVTRGVRGVSSPGAGRDSVTQSRALSPASPAPGAETAPYRVSPERSTNTDKCATHDVTNGTADVITGSEVRITEVNTGGTEVQVAYVKAAPHVTVSQLTTPEVSAVRKPSHGSQLVVSLTAAFRDKTPSRRVGSMSTKDQRLLKMILVIFLCFVVCYLPITIVKVLGKESDAPFINVLGYALIYLTTCTNPIIYVAMSSEYRQAYRQLLWCESRRCTPPGGAARSASRV